MMTERSPVVGDSAVQLERALATENTELTERAVVGECAVAKERATTAELYRCR